MLIYRWIGIRESGSKKTNLEWGWSALDSSLCSCGNSIGQRIGGTCAHGSINSPAGFEHRDWVGTRQKVKL